MKLYKTISAKSIIVFISLAFFTVFAIVFMFNGKQAVSTNAKAEAPLIIIDAGHGGEDGGTQSSDGVLEKGINLSISKKIDEILKKRGYKTLMVRTEDKLIYDSDCKTQREKKVSDIHKRMEIMKSNTDSIFLSIHQNFFSESKYHGAQVFYSKKITESEKIADSIQHSIVEKLQPDNKREIKPSGTDIYLLYNAVVPAVMVECGFMSNPEEAEKLCDEDYQTQMSDAIVDGLVEYLNNFGY